MVVSARHAVEFFHLVFLRANRREGRGQEPLRRQRRLQSPIPLWEHPVLRGPGHRRGHREGDAQEPRRPPPGIAHDHQPSARAGNPGRRCLESEADGNNPALESWSSRRGSVHRLEDEDRVLETRPSRRRRLRSHRPGVAAHRRTHPFLATHYSVPTAVAQKE